MGEIAEAVSGYCIEIARQTGGLLGISPGFKTPPPFASDVLTRFLGKFCKGVF
jgi:hypothetical protein